MLNIRFNPISAPLLAIYYSKYIRQIYIYYEMLTTTTYT